MCKYCINTACMKIKIVIRLVMDKNICLTEFFNYCINNIILHKLNIFLIRELVKIVTIYCYTKYKRNFLSLAVA